MLEVVETLDADWLILGQQEILVSDWVLTLGGILVSDWVLALEEILVPDWVLTLGGIQVVDQQVLGESQVFVLALYLVVVLFVDE